MGRPFSGSVENENGKEDNVVIRRSIFRQIRRIYGRDGLRKILGE